MNKPVLVSRITVVCYGVGHFLNDMTSACWFNYLLVFLIQVVNLSPSGAGIVMLSGQIGDALCTPIVGFLSDKTTSRFGRRKTWLVGGAIVVNLSFYFVFSHCLFCDDISKDSEILLVVYYSILAALFNFGWASLQVAHMALVPELTKDVLERVKLNSARYAGGIIATLLVLLISWISFHFYGVSNSSFRIIALSSIGIGDFFTLIFLIGVREPLPSEYALFQNTESMKFFVEMKWKHWFREVSFYQVGFVYMFTRITVNISQVFMPFYLQFSLNLYSIHPASIAEVPIVIMVTSFLCTFFLKQLNKLVGRRTTFTFGTFFSLLALTFLFILSSSWWQAIYGISFLLGIGTTTILVTSTTMQADLIGRNVESGAFVYGAISFLDKLSSGAFIEGTSRFTKEAIPVRYTIVLGPGIACVIAAIICYTTVLETPRKPRASQINVNSSTETLKLNNEPNETSPLLNFPTQN